ncbi:MAG: TIGR00282 family metallophosphoesterase [Thermoanaerobaculaceae bacterium]|nr:TIGR00282 family metallophosphoesterase [Thermoanaerobaculaceae bacterium]
MMQKVRVLFIGDIIGRTGRRIVKETLPSLKAKYEINITIANGENSAGGFGMTQEVASELFETGIDVITTGNHIWDKKEIIPFFDKNPSLLRPLNFPDNLPGKGFVRLDNLVNVPFFVVNLQGKILMPPINCPFAAMDNFLKSIPDTKRIVIVDFHAEATSEKRALGFYLDGKISLLLGTHTHIPTKDAEILPLGTGYITDVGMSGAKDSVIGMKKENSIKKIITGIPMPLEVAKNDPVFSAIFAEIDSETGKCLQIEHIYTTTKNIE